MPTFEELVESLGRMERMSVKAEIKRAGEVLRPDETPQVVCVGRYEGAGNSLVVLTDRRLVAFNETGSFNKKLIVRDLELSRITDIQSEVRRSGSEITAHSAGAKFEIHGILPADRATTIAEYLRTHAGQPSATPAAGASPTDRLAQAKSLLDAGAISQEEYDSMRQRILSEI